MTATTSSTATSAKAKLCLQYPIGSTWEFTLQGGEKVSGSIYTTDPISGIVVIRDQALNDIRMVTVASIQESKQLKEAASGEVDQVAMAHTKKALDEREKRAIRLAQESLLHLNPKASPKGQIVFDRLLKACNEVVWKGESIIVLNSIQVDPPYDQENCTQIQASSGQGSLDRVQKIVAAASVS